MKVTRIVIAALLLVAVGGSRAQLAGTKRIDLQRHDLSAPGREAVQVIVELEPGVLSPRHTHPGEEIIYVLAGSLEYEVEGKPPVTLKAGDVLFIPAETTRRRTSAHPMQRSSPRTSLKKASRSSLWPSKRFIAKAAP